jgi:hypothetical protein
MYVDFNFFYKILFSTNAVLNEPNRTSNVSSENEAMPPLCSNPQLNYLYI